MSNAACSMRARFCVHARELQWGSVPPVSSRPLSAGGSSTPCSSVEWEGIKPGCGIMVDGGSHQYVSQMFPLNLACKWEGGEGRAAFQKEGGNATISLTPTSGVLLVKVDIDNKLGKIGGGGCILPF